mmetsp:Transcript_12615/g.45369  ORF Transcript_12615/g.45369 Transcript_12615/m.45369 type:complete len:210 (+) Transcript_12615:1240-1869(+)
MTFGTVQALPGKLSYIKDYRSPGSLANRRLLTSFSRSNVINCERRIVEYIFSRFSLHVRCYPVPCTLVDVRFDEGDVSVESARELFLKSITRTKSKSRANACSRENYCAECVSRSRIRCLLAASSWPRFLQGRVRRPRRRSRRTDVFRNRGSSTLRARHPRRRDLTCQRVFAPHRSLAIYHSAACILSSSASSPLPSVCPSSVRRMMAP